MSGVKELKYKTRGGASPQGKPRVYFCCCEDDFDRVFEPVCKEILDIQLNAAIWYYDPAEGAPEEEALFENLSQMQLFVIPVTSGFLFRKNRAREVEFKYAIEHHIPVLPLVQEPGLGRDFNKLCGDLQYLDKHGSQRDTTALPYEEKLKKFLESVLVSDEMAQKIRAAFDAYIFLSYRKKDRKYAQEIMRLIHGNSFCRDIAIWYDEFLTPGENFNNEIDEALRKSSLFALVVTPHLLENPNYVMRVEYPMAKESGKPILPIEGLPTDAGELSALYTGIAPTVTAEHLTDELYDMVKNIALRENDEDPAHNFLIGLAYLSGIDVEVDHDRALALITSAVEQDLPEAYSKLISMYRNGEGVGRDYQTAISWQRKYVDYFRRAVDRECTEENLIGLIDAIWHLGDYLYERRDVEKAAEEYEEMMEQAERLDQTGYYGRRYTGAAYCRLGDTYNERGKTAQAEEAYRKSYEISAELVDETGKYLSWHDYCASCENLGKIYERQGKTDRAKKWYREAVNVREQILKESDRDNDRSYISESYKKLGNICIAEGNLKEAEEWHLKSLEICEALAEITKTEQSLRYLAESYHKMGDIRYRESRLSEAGEWYLKSYTIRQSLAEKTNSVEDRGELGKILINIGNLCAKQNKLPEAEDWYRRSLKFLQEVHRETNWEGVVHDIGVVYGNLGTICIKENNNSEAREWYSKYAQVMIDISEKENTVESRIDLAQAYERLGQIAELSGNHAEAKKWYLKKLEINKALSEETTLIKAHIQYADCCGLLGLTCISLDEQSEAEEWLLKCIELYRPVSKKTNLVEHYDAMAVCYSKLSRLSSITAEKREEYLNQLLVLSKYLYQRTKSPRIASRAAEAEESLQKIQKEKKKKKWWFLK